MKNDSVYDLGRPLDAAPEDGTVPAPRGTWPPPNRSSQRAPNHRTLRTTDDRSGNDMRRYLVIANQTLDSPALWDWAAEAVTASPDGCHFHVVAPATRVEHRFSWTEGQARAAAHERLERTLARLGDLGATVDGQVGDENPLLAASDAMLEQRYDAVVVSTLPAGVSAWLRLDVVCRLRRQVEIPVVHIDGRRAALTGARRRAGVSGHR